MRNNLMIAAALALASSASSVVTGMGYQAPWGKAPKTGRDKSKDKATIAAAQAKRLRKNEKRKAVQHDPVPANAGFALIKNCL